MLCETLQSHPVLFREDCIANRMCTHNLHFNFISIDFIKQCMHHHVQTLSFSDLSGQSLLGELLNGGEFTIGSGTSLCSSCCGL